MSDTQEIRHSLRAAALVAIPVMAFALVALFLVLGSGEDDGPEAAASGLNAGVLPEQLADQEAPRVRLRDPRGELVDTADLAGRPYLVTFLYTRCPDVCPLIAVQIRQAFERAGSEAADIPVLAVSVDPAGDSPEAARRFGERLDMPPSFQYLVGSRSELAPVWQSYFVVEQDSDNVDISTHTANIWLIGADGRLKGKYSGGSPISPDDLAEDLSTLVGQ